MYALKRLSSSITKINPKNTLQITSESLTSEPQRAVIISKLKTKPNAFTITQICKTLMEQPKLAKAPEMAALWNTIEVESINVLEHFKNENVALLVKTFSTFNKGSPEFYYEVEEAVIESDIPYSIHHLETIMESYVQMNQGSSPLIGDISRKLQKKNKLGLIDGHIEQKKLPTINKMCYLASLFDRSLNSQKGGYGLYKQVESRIMLEIKDNNLIPEDYVAIMKHLVPKNIGSNEMMKQVEEKLIKLFQHLTKSQIISIAKGCSFYRYKNLQLMILVEEAIINMLDNATIEQIVDIVWAFTREKRGTNSKLYTKLESIVGSKVQQFKPRDLAIIAEGFAKVDIGGKTVFEKIENVAMAKMSLFTSHDVIKLMKALQSNKWGSTDFYLKATYKLYESKKDLKYNDLISFLSYSYSLSTITRSLIDDEFWRYCESCFAQIIDKCPPDHIITMLHSTYMYNKASQQFLEIVIQSSIKKMKEYSVNVLGLASQLLGEYNSTGIPELVTIINKILKKPPPDISYSSIIRMLWYLAISDSLKDVDYAAHLENIVANYDSLLTEGVIQYAVQTCLYTYFTLQYQNAQNIINALGEKLSKDQLSIIINNDAASQTPPIIRQDISKYVSRQFPDSKIYTCMFDQMFNLIDLFVDSSKADAKQYAILIYNDKHYIRKQAKLFGQYQLRKKIISSLPFKCVEVNYNEWKVLTDNEKDEVASKIKQHN